MFTPKAAFNGFSVDDIAKARTFYGELLGLSLEDAPGGVKIALPGGSQGWMYPKKDHQPASYTMLNFIVDDINAAVDELVKRGVVFERYPETSQDERGIMRGKSINMGPDIAWFKDPAGNILAILQL